MSGSSANISLDSFDYEKFYDGLVLQQGVPVMDSDWNEQNDIRRIREIINNLATVGSTKLSTDGSENWGFLVQQATSPTNNFKLYAGWAMNQGVLVPTTNTIPPTNIDYNDQIMFTGTVSGIGGPATYIEDTSKNYLASHSLVGCRLIPTSGAASGTTFTISALTSSTRLTLSGGVGGILANDTYEIRPPALTTPGASRTDKVYLQVWFDDINDVEDSNIVNPGVLIETCHRVKRSWCVRVAEGGSTPANSNSDVYGFGPRYMELATLTRTTSSSILTSMISNLPGKSVISSTTASNIYFNPTNLDGHNLINFNDDNVQDALDGFGDSIASTASSKGSSLIGSFSVTASPDGLSTGTVHDQLTTLVGYINARIRNPHFRTGTILQSLGPQLIWRSHNVSSDANVTKDTVSWYIADDATNQKGCFIIIVGGYLSGTQCYKAPSGTAPTKVTMSLFNNWGYTLFGKSSVGTPWLWADPTAWDTRFMLSNRLDIDDLYSFFTGSQITLATSPIVLSDKDSYIKPSGTEPCRVVAYDDSTASPPSVTSSPAIWQTQNATYITQNCYWDSVNNLWKAHNTSLNASAIAVTANGFIFYMKNADDSISSGWPETTVAVSGDYWTSSLSLGSLDTGYSPDHLRSSFVAAGGGGSVEYIAYDAFMYSPATGSYSMWVPVNFRSYRPIAPTVSISAETTVEIASVTYVPFSTPASAIGWGGHLVITTNEIDVGEYARSSGHVVVRDS